jgi:acetoin utilization deacetylase AcuC-like enzyme
VLTVSIHADPDFEYPHYWGFADETGSGPGAGFHKNYPLQKGTEDRQYLTVLEEALHLIRGFEPQFLVVSAGMDIYSADPLGTIKVTTDGIGEIGKRIASLALPTVVVMEGGYANDVLGINVVKFLGEMK